MMMMMIMMMMMMIAIIIVIIIIMNVCCFTFRLSRLERFGIGCGVSRTHHFLIFIVCLYLQGNTHDDVLLIATSLLRVVVVAVFSMDRSLAVVVSNNALGFHVKL